MGKTGGTLTAGALFFEALFYSYCFKRKNKTARMGRFL
jgi:hypothetical protein